jgi:hypothetical protein
MKLPLKMLIILCPNHLPFQDLSDVVMSREKIIIGVNNQESLEVYHDLVKSFPKLGRYTEARMIKQDRIVADYGSAYHLYFASDFQPTPPEHPDPIIYKLTEKYPSHFIPFYPVNSGDYFIKTDEKPFYKQNKFKYQKALLENKVVQMTYPYLTVNTKRLYLPTIKMI